MAPPLEADEAFFALANRPLTVCPFCEPGMPWPDDVLAVCAKRVVEVAPFNVPIAVEGVLGVAVDPALGFYSWVRLVGATFARLRLSPTSGAQRPAAHGRPSGRPRRAKRRGPDLIPINPIRYRVG